LQVEEEMQETKFTKAVKDVETMFRAYQDELTLNQPPEYSDPAPTRKRTRKAKA